MGSDHSKATEVTDLERYCCSIDLCSAKYRSARGKHNLVEDYSAGPGIVFTVQDDKNTLIVDSFLSGGSVEDQVAEQIGIGDILISVDNSEIAGLSHSEIVRLVRGPPSTEVVLGFRPARALGSSNDDDQHYVVTVKRSAARPVLQHAFGSRKRGFPTSTRTFLIRSRNRDPRERESGHDPARSEKFPPVVSADRLCVRVRAITASVRTSV